MNAKLDKLVRLLDLERLETNLFRGESRNIVGTRVFGGQVLGQALVAAGRTVEEDRCAHSLHAYFLRAGDVEAPIVYDVERARDGGSFNTRRIVAIQHGRPIFNMSVSFQIREEGSDHQLDMPEDIPAPDDVEPEWIIMERHRERLPEAFRETFTRERPIEIRPIDPEDPMAPEPVAPVRNSWIRAAGQLPDDDTVHRALLAYASDFRLLGTALLPHGRTIFQGQTQMASLDHAMWFHREFRMDDWLLYHMDSPSASNARGFTRGHIFDRRGSLVASVAQEGLIRPREH
ncbi:acyl-CoA thioesterase II [Aquisalimonas sp.]|uniref:acyl-CoA thioesterase II n=1 Tax=Aquisalimonas sp. TaxID=1872621 RepID=UPI0025C0F16D|nr:acyl-CoA thioesterase II [Aquisalimonas sp.]